MATDAVGEGSSPNLSDAVLANTKLSELRREEGFARREERGLGGTVTLEPTLA
jgi:hypothetical protein